eukprot:CAMPEP_0119364902 /NCGR_PEP_ID=MMETSP1334-20130426/11831_1 /TAXON_ID=127549 /ORGANISM="Calcidiscus leptoporus, Strain RCC1130" /LENGTH=72 /DNA_ID=CAMNT_0007380729 /DNA_START=190 /DNA_END=408 /DNA_ORIENTATION=-
MCSQSDCHRCPRAFVRAAVHPAGELRALSAFAPSALTAFAPPALTAIAHFSFAAGAQPAREAAPMEISAGLL